METQRESTIDKTGWDCDFGTQRYEHKSEFCVDADCYICRDGLVRPKESGQNPIGLNT
jgi:hypothetical protein